VWHASISSHRLNVPVDALRRAAYEQLAGVGDAIAGEWEEIRTPYFHLRRRLSADEETLVGPALDIRGTWEATKRRRRVERWLPSGYPEEVPA
jgi:hypothetical protein